jgi:hypothetical protein
MVQCSTTPEAPNDDEIFKKSGKSNRDIIIFCKFVGKYRCRVKSLVWFISGFPFPYCGSINAIREIRHHSASNLSQRQQ